MRKTEKQIKKEMVSIYMLQYEQSELIYIGSTTDIVTRIKAHKRSNKPFWNNTLDLSIFKVTILDEVTDSERLYWERFYMELFISYGFKLKNKVRIKNLTIEYPRQPKKDKISKEDFLKQFA